MKLICSVLSAVLISTYALASTPDLVINGTQLHTIHLPKVMSVSTEKKIPLLSVHLSKRAWKTLKSNLKSAHTSSSVSSEKVLHLKEQNQLGMNGLPVLDQGPYGTCTTFAVTAAINATFSDEDSISQLCQLEFGQYLNRASHEKALSGWNGLSTSYLLHQLSVFGFVSKQNQYAGQCGPLLDYPSDGEIPSNELSIEQFSQISTPMYEKGLHWTPIVDFTQLLFGERPREYVLNEVKDAIDQGDRLILSLLIPTPDLGLAGALGQHAESIDTWVIVPEMIGEIILNPAAISAHALIITGYDDNAIATDTEGRVHKGLLTVRNSWGPEVGNHGDFYISYEYFKHLMISIERIRDLSMMNR